MRGANRHCRWGCYEKNEAGEWELNHPMQMDHVRGAFKAYHVSCLKTIGGLRSAMGWDTVDEHLARYYGYRVITLPALKVKHLRPVGAQYKKRLAFAREAFYRLRYGVFECSAAIKSGGARNLFVGQSSFCWLYTSIDKKNTAPSQCITRAFYSQLSKIALRKD